MSINPFAPNLLYCEIQTAFLAGSGCVIGDTSVTLQKFVDILGNPITMSAYFGFQGVGTFEQGTPRERQVTWTGITQNGNGTATLTGLQTVQMFGPPFIVTFTGSDIDHAGGTSFDVSDNPWLFNTFANVYNPETIVALWTFPGTTALGRPQLVVDVDATLDTELITHGELVRTAIAGVPPATDSTPGIGFDGDQAEIDAGLGSKVWSGNGSTYPIFVDGATLKQWAIDMGVPTVQSYICSETILPNQPVYPVSISSAPIVFDNSDSQHAVVNSINTPYSFSKPYVLGGGMNGYMTMAIYVSNNNAGAVAVSVPNYAGNGMTLLQHDTTGGYNRYLYGMSTVGIAAGAHNITFTITNGGFNSDCVMYEVASYFNVDSTSIVSAKAHGVDSMTINTINADSVVWGFAGVSINLAPPRVWTSVNLVDNFRNDAEDYYDGTDTAYVAAGDTGVIASSGTVTVDVDGGTLASPRIPDIMFAVAMSPFGSVIPGGVALTSTNTGNNGATFIGFSLTGGTLGQPIQVQTIFGTQIGGFSGLTPNDPYYLQDAAGTIGTSPGSNTVRCGVAINTTTLLLENGALS